MHINELKYNIDDFKKLDIDDVIIVFKGNVYPICVNDYHYDNFSYAISVVKTLCDSFDGMYDTFFEENGNLKKLFRFGPDKLLDALGNFEGLPKVLYGYVTEHDGQYALAFDSSIDVANSQELRQLMKTDIVNQFEYILFNDKAYTVEQVRNGEYDNKAEKNTNIAPTLYHGTTSKYLYSIISKGIRRVAENSYFTGIDNDGLVFLTSVYETAQKYAEMYRHRKGGSACVIAVDASKLDENKMVLDYDFATEYTTDYENSPYNDRLKPRNRFYRGDVVKNSGRHGTKYGKIGYKGMVMPGAIKGVYMDNKFYTKEQVVQMYSQQEGKGKMGKPINEYTSVHYRGQEDFRIVAYHTVRRDNILDVWYDGKLDPQAEHPGECKYDVIWFTTKESDYQGRFQFSFEIDPATFKEFGFRWMNDMHLVCEKPINLMDRRLKINRHAGINVENYYKCIVKDGTQKEYDDFFYKLFDLTDNEISNETFVDKVIQQLNLPRSVFWGGEDEYVGEDIKKVRQGIIQYGDGEGQLCEVEANDVSLSSFKVKEELHDRFWINGKLNSRVREKLLDIANDFIDELSIPNFKESDVVFTGSLANYNWSRYSDIDIHIVVSFKSIYKKTEMIDDYFKSKKELWNQTHENIRIYGFPVEISVEDEDDPGVSSGVYSLKKNKWVVEPDNFDDARMNETYIKEFAAKVMTEIDGIEGQLKKKPGNSKMEKLAERTMKLLRRLKNMRKEGLARSGEMSSGNIIYKVLRRTGYLDTIWEIINTTYDKMNTLK